MNITSLYKHIGELRICTNDREVLILAVNETRLEPDFPKELISINRYNWIGRNRRGGGIGFYTRDTLNYSVRSYLNNTQIEVLTIEISKYKTKPFLVTTWYRPPNTPVESFQEFEKLLQHIDLEDKESIILGDLNCNLISKDTNDCNTNELKFVTNMCQYKQLIQEPTRVTTKTKRWTIRYPGRGVEKFPLQEFFFLVGSFVRFFFHSISCARIFFLKGFGEK